MNKDERAVLEKQMEMLRNILERNRHDAQGVVDGLDSLIKSLDEELKLRHEGKKKLCQTA